MKKLMSVIGVIIFTVYCSSANVYAVEMDSEEKILVKYIETEESEQMTNEKSICNNISNEIDEYRDILLSKGTPEEVMNEISDSQMEYIALNLSEEAMFDSMDSAVCEDNGCVQINDISTYKVSTLSEDAIKITVLCYKISVNGEWQYVFFPSFKWLKPAYLIDNDSFAFALYSGWEVVPGFEPILYVEQIWNGDIFKTKKFKTTNVSEYGYGFNIPWGRSLSATWYEGHTMFYARKLNENATAGISVKYVHDENLYSSISYGITIKQGSVSVSSDDSRLYVYAKNLKFNYNTIK